MKKMILLAVAGLALVACADTRNHINKDSTAWETNVYQVGKDKQKLDEQQQEAGRYGEAQREYKDGVPTFR